MKKSSIIGKVTGFTIRLLITIGPISSVLAQEDLPKSPHKYEQQIHIGYATQFFDVPDVGFYAAYNPSRKINNYFSGEGQIAASFSKFGPDDDLLSRQEGGKIVLNTLVGIRAYLLPAKYDFRIYASVMYGMEYEKNEYANPSWVTSEVIEGTGALGLYAEYKHLTVGVALEGADQCIMKVGYKL